MLAILPNTNGRSAVAQLGLTDGRWSASAKFEQFEAERFDLREDAEHRGPILEQAGEHGLAALQLRHHRREGGQSGSSEPPLYPDRVQAAGLCGHAMILQPDPVSGRRRNLVIVRARARRSLRR